MASILGLHRRPAWRAGTEDLDMEMHQIRYFLAVAETLNFTRAAERCNVSQPALTRAVKTLEDELGGPLFRRERNHSHLTELGRTMHPYLTEMLVQADAAKNRARDFTRLNEVPLSVGIMCTIGPARLLGFMRGFHAKHPDVNIHLRDAAGPALTEMLANGELDVAVFARPGELDPRFHGLPLFRERFMILSAPGHRFEAMQAIPLGELAAERYLCRANCEFADYMSALYAERGVKLDIPYESERDDWIQMMVLAGLGVTFIPEHAVTVSGLVARPLVDPEVDRLLCLVTVRGRPHSPAVGAFVREAMAFRWDG